MVIKAIVIDGTAVGHKKRHRRDTGETQEERLRLISQGQKTRLKRERETKRPLIGISRSLEVSKSFRAPVNFVTEELETFVAGKKRLERRVINK